MKNRLLLFFLLAILTLTACGTEVAENAPNDIIQISSDTDINIMPPEKKTVVLEGTTQNPIETAPKENDIPSVDPAPIEATENDVSEPAPSSNTPAPGPVEEPADIKEPETPVEEKEVDISDWVLYDTDNLELLAINLLEGNVIYYNGQYWCSPEYFELLSNEEIVYEHDISEEIIPSERPGRLTPDAEYIIVEENE